MKVAVIGAGALGTFFGGILARGEDSVWLVHHDEDVARTLDEDGIRIQSDAVEIEGRIDVNATADAAEIGEADLVLVLTKTYQTRSALTSHEACIGPGTRVLSLQNGLTVSRTLSDFVPDERVLTGVTYTGAELESTGVVTHTSVGKTVFGGADEDFAKRIASGLRTGGLSEVSTVVDPSPEIWSKQLVSVAFKPTAALTGLPNGDLVANEGTASLMEQLVAEAYEVAAVQGVEIPTENPFEHVLAIGRSNPTHRSSMLQDVTAERQTEIMEANGAIVELAAEEELDVPYNSAVTSLVRGREQSYL